MQIDEAKAPEHDLRAELAKSGLKTEDSLGSASEPITVEMVVYTQNDCAPVPIDAEPLGSVPLPGRGLEHHATGNCSPCA